jgi:prevent-host-death family protein
MSQVRIADLKARLSEHLRSVRQGGTLTVLERDTPVARILPYAVPPIEIAERSGDFAIRSFHRKPSKRTDSVALLLEDRRRR